MKTTGRFLMVLGILGVAMCVSAAAGDTLYESFKDPPAQARPFVRWWWNGNCVTEKEILRELDIMKEAGIGGVEINPIAMPMSRIPGSGKENIKDANALEWLSPEWNRLVKITTDGAKKRGMIADLIVGSGWPFGGRFLKSGEQIQIVTVNRKELTGPGVFDGNTSELMTVAEGRRRRMGMEATAQKLMFLRLVPADANDRKEFQPGIDLTDKVQSDGKVKFEIPAGEYILYTGVWREGYAWVSNGAPGADGPVLNHFDKAAVEKYLNRMSDSLGPYLGGKLGNSLRAMFCDSLELSNTNWTTDIREQFEKRRGYSIDPYLPFVLKQTGGPQGSSPFADTIRRARFDFNTTIVELFHERFLQTFTEWCHRNGVLSRVQAYGREQRPLDASMLVDIPECETWIHDANKTPVPTVINKFVSSAAHLSGKSIVSCESMTNTVTVFRVALQNIKRTGDLNFLTGVNEFILHGFNYSPPEAGFPGWVQFGCYFNEHNPLWPYFRKWADYNARISSVFQNSTAQANIAVLTPNADIWSQYGRLIHPFPEKTPPWYLYTLWEAIHKNGYAADYVTEMILQKATFDGGNIHFGSRAYEALILEDVASLEPETATAIGKFAQVGGKVIFINKAPSRSPSMKDADKNDKIVKTEVETALKSDSKRVAVVPEPQKSKLLEWTGDVLAKFNITPTVKILSPNPQLSQIHHRIDDRDIFFFAYTDETQPITFKAEFPTGDKTPWRWNAETGERSVYPYSGKKNELTIHLEPLESLLLVFEPNMPGEPVKQRVVDFEKFVEIDVPWQAEFQRKITGEQFSIPMSKLMDIGASDDKRLNTFAGTITYRAEFNVTDTKNTMLDLGKVYWVSEVSLNGKNLGVRWWGRHVYDVGSVLKPGKNTIEVKVTTHLGNYVRSLKDNPAARRWAFWFPIEPLGMLGPVRLCGTK